MRKAILPRYPIDTTGLEIDLRQFTERDTPAYWETMAAEVTDKLRQLHSRGITPPDHVSVFACGPIPLLVHFGHELSNKIPTDVYQRHRDTEDWCWKNAPSPPVLYTIRKVRTGKSKGRVGVLLSLSGTIPERDLPTQAVEECTMYELTLNGIIPNPTFLNSSDDLDRFRGAYQELIGLIKLDNPEVSEIHLFAAVPAPVAVLVGRELLPKVHPTLHVYECNKANGHFKFALKVN